MNRTEKKFDAVAMMRSIRDRVSTEIEDMTLEEELEWLATQELDDPYLKRLRDRAVARWASRSQRIATSNCSSSRRFCCASSSLVM